MKRARWKNPDREELAIQCVYASCVFALGGFVFIGFDNAIAGAAVLTGVAGLFILFGIAFWDEIAG